MSAKRPETRIIGAGIVGLIVADQLVNTGMKVSVMDARPDPFAGASWKHFGTTYAGMDARHVSTTEHVSKARPFSAQKFIQLTQEKGFLPKPFEQLTPNEQYWVTTIGELADNSEFIEFVDANICMANYLGLRGWRRLMEERPALFEDVGLREGVPIFYSDSRELQTAMAYESKWDEVRPVDLKEVK